MTHKIIQQRGNRVLLGPFAGMKFPVETFDRHLGPKLLGSYEAPLASVWSGLLLQPPTQCLDIGCAEGYYAVGLARLFPDVPVHACDTDGWARQVVRRSATLNKTHNLQVHGACDRAWLQRHLHAKAFILSDCEGCEDHMLDPAEVPALARCSILVETHEHAAPGVTARLRARFTDSHLCQTFSTESPRPAPVSIVEHLTDDERRLATAEFRHGDQQWLFFTPRSR